MELAGFDHGLTSGAAWPGPSKSGASLRFSAKSALDPRRETVNQFREDHQNQLALSTTLRRGWPAAKRRQLSRRTAKRRSSRWGPKPAVCGVISTPGIVHSG